MVSKIPGRLGFPVRVRCVISATHLRNISGICTRVFPFEHIQPSTGSQGVRRSCASLLKQLQPFISCQHLFFSWGLAGQKAFVSLTPEPQQSSLSLFFARHSGRTILPGCHVENIFHILSFSDWPKSMNNLLFNLFKSFLFSGPHFKSFFFHIAW